MIIERRQHRIVALVIFVQCFIKHKYRFLIKSKSGKTQMSKNYLCQVWDLVAIWLPTHY